MGLQTLLAFVLPEAAGFERARRRQGEKACSPVTCCCPCAGQTWGCLNAGECVLVALGHVCLASTVSDVLGSLCCHSAASGEGGKGKGLPNGVHLSDLVPTKTEAIPPTTDAGNPEMLCEIFDTRQVSPCLLTSRSPARAGR
jgi:hypothetical protein